MTTPTEASGRIVQTWKDGQRILWTYVPELPAKDIRHAMPWLTVLRWEYNGSDSEGMPTAEENQHMLMLDVAVGKIERPEFCVKGYRRIGAGVREFVFYIADRDEFLEEFNHCVANDRPYQSRRGDAVSDQNQNDLRPLRLEEDALVRALLRHVTGGEQLLRQLERAQVRDMNDGGMGSLKFAGGEHRSLGSCLVEAEYLDRDGVPVSIALNSDTNGLLYELDMWKVDFAPLQEYPNFERVTIKT